MALAGTIKDFALPDIFQLIGIQRKTGVLKLTHERETVTIKFLEGQVVEADTASQSLEDRLGTVLVKTGRITKAQLDEALQVQRSTLQRLGHILVKRSMISPDELIDALQIQSAQIIYRLFRWREGSYHFEPATELDYDQTHASPLSSETILMEGARMVDEWPIIERRIPSDSVVLRRTASAAAPAAHEFVPDLQLQLDLPADGTGASGESRPPAPAFAPEEERVLALVDGRRTVREIADLLAMAEFDTFRALSELISRRVLERAPTVSHRGALRGEGASRRLALVAQWVARLLLAAVVLLILRALPANAFGPWRVLEHSALTERLRLYVGMARLERIENAIQVYYLDAGIFPRDLRELVARGCLTEESLLDPWGRPFAFRFSPGGYQIVSTGEDGQPRSALAVSHGFSEAQRLLLGQEASEATPPALEPEETPGEPPARP